MKDLIELKSRGEEHNYLRRLVKPDGSESHTYMLKTSTYAMRGGLTDKKKKFIDPSGGPMIEVGTLLNQYSDISNILNEYHKVKKIWFDTITGRPMIETEKP